MSISNVVVRRMYVSYTMIMRTLHRNLANIVILFTKTLKRYLPRTFVYSVPCVDVQEVRSDSHIFPTGIIMIHMYSCNPYARLKARGVSLVV